MKNGRRIQRARSLVNEIAAEFCRQNGVPRERRQELHELALERVAERDYSLLRLFHGKRVSLESYLSAVVAPFLEQAERDRGERLLLDHRSDIRSACARFAREKLSANDADDFHSAVLERLCEGNYRALRRFHGSSIRGYLAFIARSVFVDRFVRRNNGRFRVSRAAARLGLEAEMLEEFIYARGFTENEAIRHVQMEGWCSKSEAELAKVAAQLPAREPNREVALEEDEVERGRDDEGLVDIEAGRAEIRRAVVAAIRDAVRELPAEGRLLLRLIYSDAFSVADCGRILGRDSRGLYAERDRCLKAVRTGLSRRGIDWNQVQDLFEGGVGVELDLTDSPHLRAAGSQGDEDSRNNKVAKYFELEPDGEE